MDPRLRAVARTTVLTLNTPLAKRRTSSAFAAAPRPMKLEIGGLAPRAGWVVTNVNAVTRNYLDATSRWPLEDASIEYIFNDNVIEHITIEQGRAMLAEAFRCMRPGGVIRTVTPDVRAHVEAYLLGEKGLETLIATSYAAKGYPMEHPIDLLRTPIAMHGHHAGYVYDFETLKAELERAGFHSVVQKPAGDSAHGPLAGLENRPDDGGAQMAVEATR